MDTIRLITAYMAAGFVVLVVAVTLFGPLFVNPQGHLPPIGAITY